VLGGALTLTGTGQLLDSKLVIPSPEITCDDGSEPKVEDDLPPAELLLRDLTFEHDPESDILTNYSPLERRRIGGNDQSIYSGLTLVWGAARSSATATRELADLLTSANADIVLTRRTEGT
jgi:hypothetical protein